MTKLYQAGKSLLAVSAFMMLSTAAMAQSNQLEVRSNAPFVTPPSTPVLNNSVVLFEQARAETGGIVTGYFSGLDTGVYSSDDFELSEPARVTGFSFLGFQNNGTLLDGVLESFTVYIFANAGGQPAGNPYDDGSWLYSITLEQGDDGLTINQENNLYTFVLDLEAATDEIWQLQAERYWIVAAPTMDMDNLDGSTRWNWAQGQQTFGEPLLIDPDNNFGAGATNWTPFSTLGVAWTPAGLTFSVSGIVGEFGDPDLGDFALLSPANGAEVPVEEDGTDPVVVEWEISENAETYVWVANLPGAGFENPLLSLPSDDGGSANTLTLTTGIVYDVLVGLGVEPGSEVTVEWTVIASAGSNELQAENVWEVTFILADGPVSTEPTQTVKGFELGQNYPNPFNPTTNISFTLPEASEVRLEVYNMQGQRVASLVNSSMSAGSHIVSFDATNLSSGIYMYRMTAGAFTATNKMMLVK
ncbi:MAG: T9SS type A sorting domain-containing protein [Balneolia bacterium]|nr:T9SS type A sorting domain-containing protein [Balneolia bacterium]